jgi:hypothetical protein
MRTDRCRRRRPSRVAEARIPLLYANRIDVKARLQKEVSRRLHRFSVGAPYAACHSSAIPNSAAILSERFQLSACG